MSASLGSYVLADWLESRKGGSMRRSTATLLCSCGAALVAMAAAAASGCSALPFALLGKVLKIILSCPSTN